MKVREFRSITEAAPNVLYALKDALNKTGAELKKMSADQQLTTNIVSGSLLKSMAALEIQAKSLGPTVGQAANVILNNMVSLVGEFDQATGASKAWATSLISLANKMMDLGRSFNEFYTANKDAFSTVFSLIGEAVKILVLYKGAMLAVNLATKAYVAVTAAFGAINFLWNVAKLNALAYASAITATTVAVGLYKAAMIAVGKTVTDVDAKTSRSFIGLIGKAVVFTATMWGLDEAMNAALAPRDTKNLFKDVEEQNKQLQAKLNAFQNKDPNAEKVSAKIDVMAQYKKEYEEALTLAGANKQLAKSYKEQYDLKVKLYDEQQKRGQELIDAASNGGEDDKAAKEAAVKLAQMKEFSAQYATQIADQQRINALVAEGKSIEDARYKVELDRQLIDARKSGATEKQISDMRAALEVSKQQTDAAKEYEEALKLIQDVEKEVASDRAKDLEDFAKAKEDFLKPEKFEIGDLFGEASKSAGAFINALQEINERQEEYVKLKEKAKNLGQSTADIDKRQKQAELRGIGSILGATKGFFKEKSAGYKVLSAAEKAFRAFELAETVKNFAIKMGFINAETGAYIAGSVTKKATEAGFTAFTVVQKGIQAAASGVAALASSMAGLRFPLNLAAFAATGALLASIGIGLGGGKKSGKFAPTNEGTGTVFGDKDAKSESIKRSIDLLAENSKIELPITSAMLRSLQNIEANIGGVANLVIRNSGGVPGNNLATGVKQGTENSKLTKGVQLVSGISTAITASSVIPALGSLATGAYALAGASGAIAGVGSALGLLATTLPGIGLIVGALGLAIPAVGKAIASVVGAIFGKTKTKVTGSGLLAGPQALGSVVSDGLSLKDYVDVNIKKKSLFSSSSKNKTITSAADEELSRQFTLVLRGFYDAVKLAAVPLGENLSEVTNKLDNFVLNIGKINLKGLKGEEIQEKLEAVFGAAADSIAQAAIPGLEDFQKVGEGYFETVVRVSSGIERARLSTDRFRIGLINFADIANKQGDVTVELFRQSITAFEQSAFGFNTGVSQIVENFNGSIDELEEVFQALIDMRQQLSAAGKAVQDLSADMIKGAGSFEALKDGLTTYFEEFLSQEEQAQSMTNKLTAEFARLNLAVPQSKDGFVDLVKSIDTSTAAGQALFGSVIALSPAFLELQNILEDIGIKSAPNLLNRYVEMEARFTSLGLTMPKTTSAFDALLDSLILSDTSVVDLSKEFAILTSANQRLAETNSSVSSQTDTLRSKFAALGLEIPTSRIEFDNLILTLRGATGSSNTTSLAVESLSSEFNRLIISTKEQQAAALAVGFAYDNLNASTSTISGGTSVLANQVRALSSDFYDFQIQLAEFGGEAGQAIASVFEALFSARQNVQQDVAKITGQDKLVMSPSEIRAGLQGINTSIPMANALVQAVNTKLNLQNRLSALNGDTGLIRNSENQIANFSGALNSNRNTAANSLNSYNTTKAVIDNAVNAVLSDGNVSGGGAFFSRGDFGSQNIANQASLTRGSIGQSFSDINGIDVFSGGKQGKREGRFQEFFNSQAGMGQSFRQVIQGGLNSQLEAAFASYVSATNAANTAQVNLNNSVATNNTLVQEKLAKEKALQEANAEVLKQQDLLRKQLQEYSLDAEKNIKRLDKLRVETVRYYEAQKALSDLMTTSANKLASSLKSVRDSQLTPVQLLNQLQSEFTTAYAKAQVATGDALVNAANNLDALIKPLLDQAAVVYATGSEASNIREFVLGAGDEIVARLEALRPKDFEAESLGLLSEIDATLFSLEEASSQANKLLIAAIDLSRVQTVSELEQITRVLGGTPIDKSQFVASAKGNAFMGGSVMAFAKGGVFTNSVVSTPTIAPMSYFGEAGPEAIMPLARGGDGSLGVRIVGGNTGDAQTAANTAETNRQLAALVRLQQAGNKQIIEKLSQVEERLATVENKTRLAESA